MLCLVLLFWFDRWPMPGELWASETVHRCRLFIVFVVVVACLFVCLFCCILLFFVFCLLGVVCFFGLLVFFVCLPACMYWLFACLFCFLKELWPLS